MSPNAEEKLKRREGNRVHPSYGAVGICFLLLMLLLAACAGIGFSAVEEDEARPASDTMPHYEIEFTLSDDLNYLQGSAHIRVPNTSADPWTYLIFRLYPELEHYGGEFSIQNAAVEGSTTPFTYLEQKTAVRVELPRALLRGQTATVFLSWRLEIPQWGADTDGAYRLFGYSQDILSLPLFLPFAGGLPAWADRCERALVAGEGHQPRGRGVQLYIPIRRHRHSAERSDPRDERQTDHLDNDQ